MLNRKLGLLSDLVVAMSQLKFNVTFLLFEQKVPLNEYGYLLLKWLEGWKNP